MREDVIRVVETYIDAVRRNDPDALPPAEIAITNEPVAGTCGVADTSFDLPLCRLPFSAVT